ncbi:MAG TPA: fibronectin type III domain-containing protein [Bacteroidales bacterium]|nr:fibronectin type III domain-containing protein [Bacteroidales bacterium]
MKNQLIIFLSFLLLFTSFVTRAQDPIWAKVEASAKYQDYLTPVKPGDHNDVVITVHNDTFKMINVGLRTQDMQEVSSWVTYVDNTIDTLGLIKGQSKSFYIKVTVPAQADERNYEMPLNFDAYDRFNTNYPFQGKTQIIIVDKTGPETVGATTSATNSTVRVNFYAHDLGCSDYTNLNTDAGIEGIKSFTLNISGNGVSQSKTIAIKDGTSHTFTALPSSSELNLSVKAYDVAGNYSQVNYQVLTTPNPPENLNFTNVSYSSATLNWNSSNGATSYNVYKSNNTKVNSSPITTTSYNITNLTPNTTYSYYVKAFNEAGASPMSAISSFKTDALPSISGPSLICYSHTGYYTYTIPNLTTGYSVDWSHSPNITLMSSSGITAVFVAHNDGPASIDATIVSPTGVEYALNQKSVWSGHPVTPTNIFLTPYNPCLNQEVIAQVAPESPPISGVHYDWDNIYSYTEYNSIASEVHFTTLTRFPYTTNVKVAGVNECGSTPQYSKFLEVKDCGGGGGIVPQPASVNVLSFTIYPNPVSSELTISQNNSLSLSLDTDSTGSQTMIHSVKIVDSMGTIYYVENFGSETFSTTINVSNLKSGSYILIINEGDNAESYNFIKN